MTNKEWIESMSDEELSKYFSNCKKDTSYNTLVNLDKWLKEEHKNDKQRMD